jgi:hypothetical protein
MSALTRLHSNHDHALDDTSVADDIALLAEHYHTYAHLPSVLANMRPDTVYSDTVGAFLYGCVPVADYSVCSPACARGLTSTCAIPAYVKEAHSLTPLNAVEGNVAHIYLQTGCTLDITDKVLLNQRGIHSVAIHSQIENTISYHSGEVQLLAEVTFTPPLNPHVTNGKTGYAWVWMLLIIIVLVVITAWLLRV